MYCHREIKRIVLGSRHSRVEMTVAKKRPAMHMLDDEDTNAKNLGNPMDDNTRWMRR